MSSSTSSEITYKSFYNDLSRKGIYQANNFDIELTLPKALSGKEEMMQIRCESVTVITPQINMGVARYGNDKMNVPIDRDMEMITVGFLPNRQLDQHKAIVEWINLIINYNNNTTEVGYYDDYIGQMTVKLFDKSNKLQDEVEYVDCYPFNCSQMDLNKTVKNEADRISVNFYYRYIKAKH